MNNFDGDCYVWDTLLAQVGRERHSTLCLMQKFVNLKEMAHKGIGTVYSNKVMKVLTNEIFRFQSVVYVNEVRKKVTMKLIPRIDLKAMDEKILMCHP
ncbi:uncharacterized protein LOC127248792 [Andrographis paniculata]|uniref:uncharacterized protein LOC127248792 n=1 Tax=Andrographis paniculata TaxID=175694 RepID=UPI0021E7923F|nr:uncharacterized protein LOC127248792 [Andrographis paniculata]